MSGRTKAKIGVGALVVLVVGTAGWLLISPAIDRAKRATAARDAARIAAYDRSELRRLRIDQRLHRGAAAQPGEARVALVSALEGAITADAASRVRARTLDGPILRTNCAPVRVGPLVPNAVRGGYECVAVTSLITPEGHGARAVGGVVGYPFWAIVSYRRGTFAWCKINLLPGEAAVGLTHAVVLPPAGCDLHI